MRFENLEINSLFTTQDSTMERSPDSWYLEYGLWTSNIGITWELIGNAESQVHSRPNESGYAFNRISR